MADSIFFVISKLGWAMTRPDTLLVLGSVLVMVWLWRGRLRAAKWGASLLAAAMVALAALPIGDWLLYPLESRFSRPLADSPIDGIIVLGGGESSLLTHAGPERILNQAGERLTEALALARRHPTAQVVFSAGDGRLRLTGTPGAAIAGSYARDLGLDPDRIVLETRARNTYENGVNIQGLGIVDSGETWVLVTSAFHMPRSMGIFCGLGMNVTPYPVDFRADWSRSVLRWRFTKTLTHTTTATREYAGLLAYWATGRIPTPFPTACHES